MRKYKSKCWTGLGKTLIALIALTLTLATMNGIGFVPFMPPLQVSLEVL